MKLDKDTIVDAALELLNETGIDGLSTRVLAQRLGVQQPALYWHFKNKRALLNAMNAVIIDRHHICREPAQAQSWQDFLRENALSFRAALLRFRDGARVHAGTEAAPEDLAQFQRVMAFLKSHGLTAAQAMGVSIAIGRYVVGCVLEEQSEMPTPESIAVLDQAGQAFPDVAEGLSIYRTRSPQMHFMVGIDLMIAGLEASLDR